MEQLLFLLEFITNHEDKKANEVTLSWGLSNRLKPIHANTYYSYCLHMYTHICISALIGVGKNLHDNFSKTLWKWDCRKMQPVTQDEKILPVCLQVFNMSSIRYPADAQQQPNSSHIHHSKFTTSVNWRIIKCHSCTNEVMVSVCVSLNPKATNVIYIWSTHSWCF